MGANLFFMGVKKIYQIRKKKIVGAVALMGRLIRP